MKSQTSLDPISSGVTHMEIKTYDYMHQDNLTQKLNVEKILSLLKIKMPQILKNINKNC